MSRNPIGGLITLALFLAGCSSGQPVTSPTPVVQIPSEQEPKPIEDAPSDIEPTSRVGNHTSTDSGGLPPLPIIWEGTFDDPGYGEHPMILTVERVQGTTFAGQVEWPAFETVTAVVGEMIEDTEESEQWTQVEGFEAGVGIGLIFTETDYLQGDGTLLGGWYFGHYRPAEETMLGVWFPEREATEAIGSFAVTVQPPPPE